MDIVCLLFDGITALDIVGPYEVLQRLPEADVKFVAADGGRDPHRQRVPRARRRRDARRRRPGPTCSSCPAGSRRARSRRTSALLEWIRAIDATTTWTTSVCTGSMLLAAAGLLEGKEATTHWASLERLREYGAIPTGRRVVEQGKIVTAAGVSAGIDMALTLAARIAGDEYAQGIQLGIEYDPQPPFDAGSLDKAPAPVVEYLTEALPSVGSRAPHVRRTCRAVSRRRPRRRSRRVPRRGRLLDVARRHAGRDARGEWTPRCRATGAPLVARRRSSCTSSPDETDTLAHIPDSVVFPAPRMPRGSCAARATTGAGTARCSSTIVLDLRAPSGHDVPDLRLPGLPRRPRSSVRRGEGCDHPPGAPVAVHVPGNSRSCGARRVYRGPRSPRVRNAATGCDAGAIRAVEGYERGCRRER